METGDDITSQFLKSATSGNAIKTQTTAADTGADAGTDTAPDTTAAHPVTQIMDFAVHTAAPICTRKGLEPPAIDTYESFTRDVVNEAAWAYLPSVNGDGESPKWLILIMAVGGMLLVFLPTILSVIEQKKQQAIAAAEEEAEEQPQEIRPEPRQEIREEPDETPKPIPAPEDTPNIVGL